MRKILNKVNWKIVLIFALLLVVGLINTFHEDYPDEYDSIVGGKYILQGKVPYRDWFQHHQPFAYIVASFILPFSGTNFVLFRVFLAIFYFFLNIGSYLIVKQRFKKSALPYYLIYLVFSTFLATYYWGQMLLADTLAAYLIIPAFALIVVKTFKNEMFEQRDLLIISIYLFLAWFTSMTYTYLIGGLYLFTLYRYYLSVKVKKLSLLYFTKKSALILITPYILLLLFLILTGSVKDYYFANITYNQEYYIYNYPKAPGAGINPVRYAIIIFTDFANNFFPLLTSFKDFRLGDPLNVTLGFSYFAFIVYIISKKKYSLLIPIFFALVYSNSRSNPALIKETDYQSSVYILSASFVGSYSLFLLKRSLSEVESLVVKIISGVLFIILGTYAIFTAFFIPLKFWQKAFVKYMGTAPLIYNRPQVAPFINMVVSKDEYAWVGPFEFKELLYLKTKVPSKYHWFLNHAVESDKMRTEILSDFNKNRAKIIVFKRDYAPWGGNPATFNYFFTDLLDKNYFRLYELNDKKIIYKWKIGKSQNFDPESDYNIERASKEEILQKLLSLGLIEKVEKK